MRKFYESDSDRENESAFMEELSKIWKCRYMKMAPRFHLDYFLFRERKGMAFLEFKKRANPKTQYPTIMFEICKRTAALDYIGATGLPTFFVAQWSDSTGYINISSEAPDHVDWGGRTDRNDSADTGPMLHYRVDRFIAIGRSTQTDPDPHTNQPRSNQ